MVALRRFSAVGRAWERRLGRYPGDWVWVSLLLLLVAAGSAAAGIVAARDTKTTSGSKTIVAISPVVTAPPAPPVTPTTTTAPVTPTPASPLQPKPRPSEPIAWPARNGFTIVLASIPARGNGQADAEAKAKEAIRRGMRAVGILTSDRFASLHPGYFVVFAGIYDSLEEAQTAARRALSRFPNAYAREIAR
jgi:hypothetical protein